MPESRPAQASDAYEIRTEHWFDSDIECSTTIATSIADSGGHSFAHELNGELLALAGRSGCDVWFCWDIRYTRDHGYSIARFLKTLVDEWKQEVNFLRCVVDVEHDDHLAVWLGGEVGPAVPSEIYPGKSFRVVTWQS